MPGPLRFLRDQQSADRLHALARLEEADLHQPFILAPAHAACSNARHRSETIEPRAPGSMSDVRDSNAQPTSSRSSGITQSGRSPAATRWMLSKAFRNARRQFSHVGPAM